VQQVIARRPAQSEREGAVPASELLDGPSKLEGWDPEADRSSPETAQASVIETHTSILFFVGDRVYKLRKPVQFDFLDFRLRTTRQTDCEREVTLNRRLAPDVYVGVADLLMDGEPIDHLVVMRRMPEARRLAAFARQGADLDPWLLQVAEILASFHGKAERSPEISAHATGAALRAIWEDSFAETDPFVGTVLDEAVEVEIRSLASRWIEGRQRLLDERIASGCICDGHGDLQAEDIFCLDDGIRILDCIEFSDRLRYCDVCADVAFLVMDLERLGRPEAAARFLLAYQELAGDRFPASLVHQYCASRAYVRTKVACLRSAQRSDGARGDARELHAMTLDHLRRGRVRLVLVGGLPGSGKSTLAAGLRVTMDWKVLRSDEIRQSRYGPSMKPILSNGGHPGYLEGRYSPAMTASVYQELLGRAEDSLGLGESVVLDASWVDASLREAARLVADRTSSDLIELLCVANPEEATARMMRRLSEHTDISEATPEVSMAMSRSMDPWTSAVIVDTSALTPEGAVARALTVLTQ
jgi:aminoglycoside phosphotransferase family enzyme/predicted kinase